MKKEIKSWLTGNVLYSADAENIKELLMSAIKSGADLTGAGLTVQTCPVQTCPVQTCKVQTCPM